MKLALILALALGLSACNVRMETDDDLNTPFSFPNLKGSWKSNCAQGSSANTWKVDTLDITETAFVAHTTLFSNSTCTQQVAAAIKTLDGTYTITGQDSFYVDGFDLTIVYTDTSGTQRTGYQLGEVYNGKLYMGSYMGLNPQSRPGMVDRNLGFERN